jgi:hypothetical protein
VAQELFLLLKGSVQVRQATFREHFAQFREHSGRGGARTVPASQGQRPGETGNIQGTFRTVQGTSGTSQGTVDTIQGTFGTIQGTLGNIQREVAQELFLLRKGSVQMRQGTFWEHFAQFRGLSGDVSHSSGNIQGVFRELTK